MYSRGTLSVHLPGGERCKFMLEVSISEMVEKIWEKDIS